MGLDWRTLTWREYQFMLTGWNIAHADEKDKSATDTSRLKRFMAAHSLH